MKNLPNIKTLLLLTQIVAINSTINTTNEAKILKVNQISKNSLEDDLDNIAEELMQELEDSKKEKNVLNFTLNELIEQLQSGSIDLQNIDKNLLDSIGLNAKTLEAITPTQRKLSSNNEIEAQKKSFSKEQILYIKNILIASYKNNITKLQKKLQIFEERKNDIKKTLENSSENNKELAKQYKKTIKKESKIKKEIESFKENIENIKSNQDTLSTLEKLKATQKILFDYTTEINEPTYQYLKLIFENKGLSLAQQINLQKTLAHGTNETLKYAQETKSLTTQEENEINEKKLKEDTKLDNLTKKLEQNFKKSQGFSLLESEESENEMEKFLKFFAAYSVLFNYKKYEEPGKEKTLSKKITAPFTYITHKLKSLF